MDLDIPAIEAKWKKFWTENDIYSYDTTVRDRSKWFSIDTPPPTISGKMHMGHAFSYPHQDFIARYKRMRGYQVYYPWGFDDNGLPTERYTEKALGIKGERTELSEFIRLCMAESEKAEDELSRTWYDLGMSANFGRAYRTFSDDSKRISQRMFLDLVKKDRVYREEAPTIRCPTCRTAISQIELKDQSMSTDFVYVHFGEGENSITIATTRPELIGACVGIIVNPEDDRYRALVGRKIQVPVYGHEVPVIADEMAIMDKGTGAEMLCTFGDQNDLALWRKYSLDLRVLIDDHGKMGESAGPLSGMAIHEARKAMVGILQEKGFVEKSERIKHSVNTHERCGTPVEIGISKQWFVKYLDLKESFKGIASQVQWMPEHMKVRLDNWIDGLKWDWCISRQRFLGVPFPVWHCTSCGAAVYADEDSLPVDPRVDPAPAKCGHCGSGDLEPDTDVMDTWATSSLSPRLALVPDGLLDFLYPMDIRFQGHDIISFWAFTSIVRSYMHDGTAPWNTIFISGNVFDPTGQKMSKSKGNIIEPGALIEQYGADSVRYWASTTIPGEDIRVKEQDFVRGRRTLIKMYNAANLVKIITGTARPAPMKGEAKHPVNRWILGKLDAVVGECTAHMDGFQAARSRSELDNFFWNVFCDNYLELAKSLNYRREKMPEDLMEETVATLNHVLFQTMKMYAPILPFITEEIYHSLELGNGKSIHLESWPEVQGTTSGSEVQEFDYVISLIGKIRAYKTSRKLPMNAELPELNVSGDAGIIGKNREIIEIAMNIARVNASPSENIEITEAA